MPQESYLARRTFGVPHWLLIAVITCFAVGWMPRGVRQALLTNNNDAADWLPASYQESQELIWFRDHFVSAQFVLASWEGCTLGDNSQLRLLAEKLRAAKSDDGHKYFGNVVTGPEMIARLTQEPAMLSRQGAIDRLEGALVGKPAVDQQGNPLGEGTRPTCLVAFLSDYATTGNVRMRAAVQRIEEIATTECGIKFEQLHLGGPPVDNITIDIEGEKTLTRLAVYSGLVGLTLAYFFFRSIPTTLVVFAVAGISAGASLAVVYYYRVGMETWLLGMEKPRYGSVDAILLSMPAVVYVLGLAGAIHLVNYYRDERDEHGAEGAAERAVRIGFTPCILAAFTTAVGLGTLATSDIVPIMKFGGFTAAGVLVTMVVLFSVLPVFLHVYPPKLRGDRDADEDDGHTPAPKQGSNLPGWAQSYCNYVTSHPLRVSGLCALAMVFFAFGLPQIRSSVQLLKLLDPDVKLIHDYAWLEKHLGNLVPMEVVIALPPERLRSPDEGTDGAGGVYRMTMFERMKMAERVQHRVETLHDVSRAMSAATFRPESEPPRSNIERRRTEYATSLALESNRPQLKDYMRTEIQPAGVNKPPRELWRVSARVGALADIDYGQFVYELRSAVEPVLDAYRTRDKVIEQLGEKGASIQSAQVLVAFEGKDTRPKEDTPGGLLLDILDEAMVQRGKAIPLNLAQFTGQFSGADEATRAATLKQFQSLDAVVAATPQAAAHLTALAPGLKIVQPVVSDAVDPGDDSQLATIYTGIVPLVYKTQRELLSSLRESILWATLIIAGVMMLLFRTIGGGVVSMLPNVFPIIVVFGGLGWLGIKVDIGIMMTASVALGVAVDDTIHFLTWFRRGVRDGLDRQTATRMAFERCSIAMAQTTLIGGLGLAVFATSTFTPTQQFGILMITILGVALVGDLVMLPALLCSPLGKFFAPKSPAWPSNPGERSGAAPSRPALAPRAAEPDTPLIEQPVEQRATGDSSEEPPPEAFPDPPARRASSEGLSPANAALHAKLKRLRKHG